MYRPILSISAMVAALCAVSQTYVHQVVVLNEGYYDQMTQQQVVPVSVGTYDPLSATYQEFAQVTGARFATDVLVDEGVIYVAADESLIAYDADSYAVLNLTTVTGIRKLAVWNDKLVLTRGELGGLDHYFEVRNKQTLALDYSIDPVDGLIHSAEDVVVVDDKAYLGVNNAFDWGNMVGYIGVVDLLTGTYVDQIDLGPDGINPEHIMVTADALLIFNNQDFSRSSISSVDRSSGQLQYTNNVAILSGCAASALVDDHIYYLEYAVDRMARFSVPLAAIADTLTATISPYGLVHDPLNNVIYATTTDYTTQGSLHVLDLAGNELTTAAVSVSPGNLALDIRAATGISSNESITLSVFPNPTTDMVTVSGIPTNVDRLIIRDVLGRELASVTVQGRSVRMDMRAYAPGSYMLEAEGIMPVRIVKR